MRVKIAYLNFIDKKNLPHECSKAKFNKYPVRFSDISKFTDIKCKVDKVEQDYEAIRSKKTRSNQWNVYQINLKETPAKYNKYYFWFIIENKMDFVRIFEERLNRKLFPPDDNFKARVNHLI